MRNIIRSPDRGAAKALRDCFAAIAPYHETNADQDSVSRFLRRAGATATSRLAFAYAKAEHGMCGMTACVVAK